MKSRSMWLKCGAAGSLLVCTLTMPACTTMMPAPSVAKPQEPSAVKAREPSATREPSAAKVPEPSGAAAAFTPLVRSTIAALLNKKADDITAADLAGIMELSLAGATDAIRFDSVVDTGRYVKIVSPGVGKSGVGVVRPRSTQKKNATAFCAVAMVFRLRLEPLGPGQ